MPRHDFVWKPGIPIAYPTPTNTTKCRNLRLKQKDRNAASSFQFEISFNSFLRIYILGSRNSSQSSHNNTWNFPSPSCHQQPHRGSASGYNLWSIIFPILIRCHCFRRSASHLCGKWAHARGCKIGCFRFLLFEGEQCFVCFVHTGFDG